MLSGRRFCANEDAMKTRTLAIVMAAAIVFGCAHSRSHYVQPTYTSEQQTYVDNIMARPLEVSIAKNEITDAWGRAQSFIAKYSDLKLQVVTDYSVQTYNSYRIFMFGYSATKTPTKGGFTISVNCSSADSLNRTTREWIEKDLNLNAHILAYYVETGELPYPEMIKTLSRHLQDLKDQKNER